MPARAAQEVVGTVELFGVCIANTMHWPPMAGRMLATLMLHDGPMTAQELRTALGASPGAVSQCSRMLVDSGVIRRFKAPGSRMTSFVYREDAWIGCLQHELSTSEELRKLAESAIAGADATSPAIRRRFRDMRNYYVFLAKAYVQLESEFRAMNGD